MKGEIVFFCLFSYCAYWNLMCKCWRRCDSGICIYLELSFVSLPCIVIVNCTSIHIMRLLTFSTMFLCCRLVGGVCWCVEIYWNANLSSYLLFRESCAGPPTPPLFLVTQSLYSLLSEESNAIVTQILFFPHEDTLIKLSNNWYSQLYPYVLTFRGKACFLL